MYARRIRLFPLERRATTKNNENQSVCDRFSIVYRLYWNFLPRLGKLLNTRLNFGSTTPRIRQLFSSVISSSSQRRPRAIDATKVARFSERIGRACCGDIPSGRRIAILRSVSLRRVIPPRQFCDQMSLSDNIIQKVLAFRAPLERYCPRDRFDTDCVLGTQFSF